jgi:aldehyde dehydrogenase (NAD+)
VRCLATGDPADEATDVGPVINDAAAERITDWIAEAVAAGADLLAGGARAGRTIAPTLLAKVAPETLLAQEEVFGPVTTIDRYVTLDEAFATVNASRFGLQAGVFTTELEVAFRAHRALEVGGVIIGDVPTFRADQMPYGGWKASGVGREGVRAAMTDLTDERVLVLSGVAL